MPYYRCTGCDLTVYSGAGHSSERACPNCGDALRADARLFVPQRTRELHRQMVRQPQAAAAARRELELLAGVVDRDELDVIALLVTELIANSVKHAGRGAGNMFGLDVWTSARTLRVMVSDGGSGFMPHTRAGLEPTDGHWGLQLVGSLADRWGVETDGPTAVWFELDRAAAALPERQAV